MNEFIEKLIGRLEEEKNKELLREDNIDENGMYNDCEEAYEDGQSNGRYQMCMRILKFVNKLAEEYNDESVKGDLISRQTVLEVLEKSFNNYAIPWCKNAFSIKIKNEIISIPTTYNDGWIPVEHRLPDFLDNVLVCTKNGGRTIAHLKHTPIEWRDMHMNKIDDVIAWKHLDAPYQPKGE